MAHEFFYPEACEIFPDQGSTPCPLYWQPDSNLLGHLGSPFLAYFEDSTCFPGLLKGSDDIGIVLIAVPGAE